MMQPEHEHSYNVPGRVEPVDVENEMKKMKGEDNTSNTFATEFSFRRNFNKLSLAVLVLPARFRPQNLVWCQGFL